MALSGRNWVAISDHIGSGWRGPLDDHGFKQAVNSTSIILSGSVCLWIHRCMAGLEGARHREAASPVQQEVSSAHAIAHACQALQGKEQAQLHRQVWQKDSFFGTKALNTKLSCLRGIQTFLRPTHPRPQEIWRSMLCSSPCGAAPRSAQVLPQREIR